jgi:hypothetical protein
MNGHDENALEAKTRRQRLMAVDGALALLVILLVMQMWLFTATLESFLAGDREASVPGLVVSSLLFLGCLGLYRLIARVDADKH